MHEETIVYVYVPDEGVYGTIISQGAWVSLIQYYEDGIEYKIEMSNDEFIVIDEIGIGYETGENYQ
jgi:hypothetical protein